MQNITIKRIGPATLYLGDCQRVLAQLDTIDAVVTDPPYGMAWRSRGLHRRPIANDNTPDMLQWACAIEALHSKYVFCRWNNLTDVRLPKSLITCTWVKNNWTCGDTKHAHARQTESVLFYPGPEHYWPGKRPADVIYAKKTANDNHPSEKPLPLMHTVVSWTAGVVFDPFMGSGTTGVACIEAGRPFIGVEIDPEHFATACRRIADAWRTRNKD